MKLAESGQPIHADWVSLKLYAELSGYSVATIRGFIKTHWTNGIEYVNRGRIAVNVEEADRSWSKGLKSEGIQSGSSSTARSGRSEVSPPRRRSQRWQQSGDESNQESMS